VSNRQLPVADQPDPESKLSTNGSGAGSGVLVGKAVGVAVGRGSVVGKAIGVGVAGGMLVGVAVGTATTGVGVGVTTNGVLNANASMAMVPDTG
jgi:hypothetical protein